jgi:hypothetical protein
VSEEFFKSRTGQLRLLQLERELNAANEMFRKLNIHALNLTDRIRRLEEAGNAILNAENDDEEYKAILQWNKAKEAKP